jgi:NADPH2:quinone reductase
MRAVQVSVFDGPAAVEIRQVPEPDRKPGTVLIETAAASVNFTDVLATKGELQYRVPLPFTLGTELAGVVREAPEGSLLRPGDRVAAKIEPTREHSTGAFADAVAVRATQVFPLPDAVSFEKAACLPMNYLTAHFMLLERQHVREGQLVLVHGAAGGLGIAVIQLAVAIGARVIAVVSTGAKADAARMAGAHEVVLSGGFRESVLMSHPNGVDFVVDPVGGDRFTDSLRCLAPFGRLLVVGFASGEIPTTRVNRLLLNNIDVVGVSWGAHAYQRPEFPSRQWQALLPLLASGALDPPISRVLPLEAASEALAALSHREIIGKIVLTMDRSPHHEPGQESCHAHPGRPAGVDRSAAAPLEAKPRS